jgi:hypothetical protein
MQRNGCAVSGSAVLAWPDQSSRVLDDSAGRARAANVDPHRPLCMLQPGSANITGMQQAQIISATNIQIGAREPEPTVPLK